jgi:16S rRNA (cytosine1402-N4)-methyltransferase
LIVTTLGPRRERKVHLATRTFQALRIAVNNELDNLREGLVAAAQLLAPEGTLVVISYHSLEDRVVKTYIARESAGCICPPEVLVCVCGHQPTLGRVSRRVIKPSAREVQSNPRSRSARMRVARRL